MTEKTTKNRKIIPVVVFDNGSMNPVHIVAGNESGSYKERELPMMIPVDVTDEIFFSFYKFDRIVSAIELKHKHNIKLTKEEAERVKNAKDNS